MSIAGRSRPPVTPKNQSADKLRMSHLSLSSFTPLCASTSSMLVVSHTKSTIDPLVRKDMKQFTKNVPVDHWVEGVCGRNKDTINAWESYFKDINLFNDSQVREHIKAFCDAACETERYDPFTALTEIILAHARSGKLEGIMGSPPISDIGVFSHHAKKIPGSDHHGSQASNRMPDVVVTRKAEIDRIKAGGSRLTWPSIIACIELQYGYRLASQLAFEQKQRSGDTSALSDEISLQGKAVFPRIDGLADPAATGSAEEAAAHETASTGSKRSRTSEASNCSRPSKKSRSLTSNTHPRLASFTLRDKDQVGRYALEMLSSTNGTRSHAITLGLRADLVSLWYFDASGIVRTCSTESKENLSLLSHFERVAAIIVALAYCEPEQFGAYPTTIVTPPSDVPFAASFPTPSLASFTITFPCLLDLELDEYTVTFRNLIHSQYGIVSRHSNVYTGQSPGAASDSSDVVVKLSQQYEGRTSEVDLIKKAKEKKIEHIAEIYAWKDFAKLSERGPRKFLSVAVDERIFRAIVMPCYEPLKERLKQNPDSLKIMAEQLIDCIHKLRFDAQILHRDISANNIMYTVKDGKDWFVLIDFDLGVHVDENGHPLGHSSLHRTGTLPFMARELISDLAGTYNTSHINIAKRQHCIRHDFESLFWVSLWCAIRFISPAYKGDCGTWKEKSGPYLSSWESGSAENPYASISSLKDSILTDSYEFLRALSFLSPSFKHMGGWLEAFRLPFAEAASTSKINDVKRGLKFKGVLTATPEKLLSKWSDYETGYGKVTRDTLMQALGQWEVPDIDSLPENSAEESTSLGEDIYSDDEESQAEDD